jgi:hypothetical protein
MALRPKAELGIAETENHMWRGMICRSSPSFFSAAFALSVFCGLIMATAGNCQLSLQNPDNLNTSERLLVLESLQALYPEEMGFKVEAPIEPEGGTREDFARLLKAFRVVVIPPHVTVSDASRRLLQPGSPFKQLLDHGEHGEFLPEAPVGYSGVLASARLNKKLVDLNFITVNMNRWLIWAKTHYFPVWKGERDTPMQEYAAAVSQYMRRNDFGNINTEEPKASALRAPRKADLYGSVGAWSVDPGEYSSIVLAHREMDFHLAKGVMSFVAGEGAIDWLTGHGGKTRFYENNQAHVQRIFQSFIEEGRSFLELRTLTPELIKELEPGRYFYAVDEYGRIRFGSRNTNEAKDPMSLWTERAKAYECLLFPGQPVLAAGEFLIAEDAPPLEASLSDYSSAPARLRSVNAFSGYFFYRPGGKRLKKDVRDMSDKYLVSTGHFLKALRRMGVPPDGIRISKF